MGIFVGKAKCYRKYNKWDVILLTGQLFALIMAALSEKDSRSVTSSCGRPRARMRAIAHSQAVAVLALSKAFCMYYIKNSWKLIIKPLKCQ